MNNLMFNTAFEKDIRQLVESQRAYFKSNATKSIDFRLKQLKKLKALLLEHEEELHDAIYKDFGKSMYETQLTELIPTHHELDAAIKNLRKWARPKKVGTNLLNFPAKS
ncbi:MAG: aldehyde dehydrogenase, partial [Bacteroidota bacterium]